MNTSTTKLGTMLLVAILAAGCDGDGNDTPDSGLPDGGEPDGGQPDAEVPPLPESSLELVHEGVVLGEAAREAVELAPTWLRLELTDNLARLPEEVQDELANLIIDVEDPRWRDELAFTLAHTSPAALHHRSFFPQLLVDNVRAVYAVDPDLEFVELVEYGDAEAGGDYSTTAKYWIREEDGTVVEDEIPREVYYWNVVHPRLEDENPFFIDAYHTCRSRTLQCPTLPDQGEFWRPFLWTADDPAGCPGVEECPVLAELMEGVDVLWDYEAAADGVPVEENGAIGAITAWILGVLDFGAQSERSIQPNRIYGLHHGNCGEHADMTSAAGRTALIPMTNVGAKANDHTWNEFWERGGWRQMEPIGRSVDRYTYYVDENGDFRWNRNRQDDDCDGVADEGTDTEDQDEDGYSMADGDCHDGDARFYPGAPEIPDGRDNDCDGVADEGAAEIDGDGDGVTMADGDCNDHDPTVYPGAEEVIDGRDNDCDSVADEGVEERDEDEDGQTIAEGDCDDTNPNAHLGAEERPDGVDNNCNGVADEGAMGMDWDEDGLSLEDGDCNDLNANHQPGVEDPRMSNNRLYAISGFRGDAMVFNRTESYGSPFTLEVTVTDRDGRPIDGAVIAIYGPITVYPEYEGHLWYAIEGYTDREGAASLLLGEANDYYARVDTPIGSFPVDENRVVAVAEWPLRDEVVTWEVEIDAEMPSELPLEEDGSLVSPEGDLQIIYTFDASDAILHADNSVLSSDLMGVSFGERLVGAGSVDAFVTDQAGYDAFLIGEETIPARGILRGAGATSGGGILTSDRSWFLVLANPEAVSSTMIGTLDITLQALYQEEWIDVDDLALDLVIPPGEHVAVQVVP